MKLLWESKMKFPKVMGMLKENEIPKIVNKRK